MRVVDVGKAPGRHALAQDRINDLLVEEALAGRAVVRLKGGDPYVLGRGGEERLACEAHGIRVEVVPGVTSAVAVPAAAGIPVTHRGVARGFTVVTGHEELPAVPARHRPHGRPAHGRGPPGALRRRPLAAGRPASCPVAIVERGFLPDQRVTFGTLGDIAGRAAAGRRREPGRRRRRRRRALSPLHAGPSVAPPALTRERLEPRAEPRGAAAGHLATRTPCWTSRTSRGRDVRGRRMKVVCYTSPSRGHLFPTVPILLELRRRGHDAMVRTIGAEVPALHDLGLRATPVSPAVEAIEMTDYRARSAQEGIKRAVRVFVRRATVDVPEVQRLIAEELAGPRAGGLEQLGCHGGRGGLRPALGDPPALPHPLPSREVPPFGSGSAPDGRAARSEPVTGC